MSQYLEMVDNPVHVKKLTLDQLQLLAEEIRQELIMVLAKNGGHLGPNLGVVELTLALHYVFSTPKDKFVWDVSHQSYVHKLLTGRKSRFHTIRSSGGISGFSMRCESEHDCYGAAHAGNAGGKSVWYRFTPTSSGRVTIDTCSYASFDTLLAVYTGSSVGALTSVASNDDTVGCGSGTASRVSFDATAGTTYRIAVDGKNGASGQFTIAISPAKMIDTPRTWTGSIQ